MSEKPSVDEQKRRAAEFLHKRKHAKRAQNLKHATRDGEVKRTVDTDGRAITVHIRQLGALEMTAEVVETGEKFEGQEALVVDWFEGLMANFVEDESMGVP